MSVNKLQKSQNSFLIVYPGISVLVGKMLYTSSLRLLQMIA